MKHDDDWYTTVFEPERWTLPGDTVQVGRILVEVRQRRRRRRAVRMGAGVVAAGLVATTTFVVIKSDPRMVQAPPRPVTFQSQPQITGPLPEPQAKQISGLSELTGLLPGLSVTEHDLGSFDPVAIDIKGDLVGIDDQGGRRELAALDVGSGHRTPIAELERSYVDHAWSDGDVFVWLESEHVDVDGLGYQPEQQVVRCHDQFGLEAHRLSLPAANPRGQPYPRQWGLGGTAVGWSGRIFLSMNLETTGPSGSFVEVSDLYVFVPDDYNSDRCVGRFELLQASARDPQFSGQWMYYLHSEAGTDGIWRRTMASDPELVVAPAGTFALTDNALVWDANRLGHSLETADLHVARADGTHPRPIPTAAGMFLRGDPGRTATYGDLFEELGLSDAYRGWWLYLPSWGAIVSTSNPAELGPLDAAGQRMLFVEHDAGGDPTGKIWMVRLPAQ